MKISTKSRYALEALVYMSANHKEEPVSIKQIAEGTSISLKYLEQIFLALRRAGILAAVRGSAGGFYISEAVSNISVGRIVRAIETNVVPVACAEDLSKCKSRVRANCVTRGLWIKLSNSINNVLDSITLESLMNQYEEKVGLK